MSKIGIEQIYKVTPQQIRDGFIGTIGVEFSDGVVIDMNAAELIISRYLWEITFQHSAIHYLHSDACIKHYYDSGTFHDGVIRKVLSNQIKRIINTAISTTGITKDFIHDITNTVIWITNKLHNELGYSLMSYVGGFDLIDILDLQLYPPLVETIKEVKRNPSKETIEESAKAIRDYMETNKKGGLAMMYFTGALKKVQVDILVGPRGRLNEINGMSFPEVITNSFVMGLNRTADYYGESRTSAKSAIQSKKAIEDSETLGRLTANISTILSSIKFTDCGSTDYEEVYINPATDKRPSDLEYHQHRFYLDEKTNTLKVLNKEDTHLIGTVIKKRSVHGCKLKDRGHVCLQCFGTIGLNIGKQVNIGHLSIIILTKILTSSFLATKHHVGGSYDTKTLVLDGAVASYFKVDKTNKHLLMRKPAKVAGVKINFRFDLKQAILLTNTPDKVKTIDTSRSSQINSMRVERIVDGYSEITTLILLNEGRPFYLTNDFLYYATNNNTTLDKNEVVVNMNGWNQLTTPIMTVVNKEYNLMQMTDEIKSLLLMAKSKANGNDFKTMTQFTSKLFNTINEKLGINSAWIESFAYAFAKQLDSGLPPRGDEEYVIEGESVLSDRSFAGMSAHNAFAQKIVKPQLFCVDTPVSHPTDPLFRMDQYIKQMPPELRANALPKNNLGQLHD